MVKVPLSGRGFVISKRTVNLPATLFCEGCPERDTPLVRVTYCTWKLLEVVWVSRKVSDES